MDNGDGAVRMACADSLATFAETMVPSYAAAAVHRLLASKLEDCYARKIRRLCISVPPRMGKTTLSSVLFPAWALTKNPRLEFITASYSSELSEAFSAQVKGVLTSPIYQALFPPIVANDQNRLRDWSTTSGGHFFASSVGAGATGRGCDVLILDDVVKNREEADSETLRELLWNWYVSTAMTRLAPDGVIIIVGTRWHQDDLIGRVTDPERVRQLEAAGAINAKFEVLNLEALCEHPETDPLHRQVGESLWPERWSKEKLLEIKATIGSREFAGQYMGRPAAPGGNLCDISKIRYVEAADVPTGLRIVRGWDCALGIAAHNDFSCGALVGVDPKTGDVYLLHMSRGKRRWPQQKALIVEMSLAESTEHEGQTWYRVAFETVAAWSACFDEVKAGLMGKVRVEAVLPSESKEARAQPWFNKVDAGAFYLVRGAWNQDFLGELEQFPNGRHDDQVDAVSIAYSIAGKKPDGFMFACGGDTPPQNRGGGLHGDGGGSLYEGGLHGSSRGGFFS
jgi:predicted phage terminase large subunit-like protein